MENEMQPQAQPKRRTRFFLFALLVAAVAIFAATAFGAGLMIGRQTPEVVSIRDVENLKLAPDQKADFAAFWQAWNILNQSYLRNSEVKPQDKVYGAISGLVRSLGDPYSEFFKPSDAKTFQEDIQGNFGGVGMQFGVRKGQLVVIAPLKGTPAAKAGLKAGDFILKINASSTDGMSTELASTLIRGKPGTTVTLQIYRTDWDKPKDIPIVRAVIDVPTLDYTLKDGRIGYVQLYGFTGTASDLFANAARQMQRDHVRGIILDLRDNPGGYLEVAVDIAGWLVPRGKVVVSEENQTSTVQQFTASGNAALADIPLVVLVNKGSASASEILAGALRDDRQVKLVGEQSFGKGTVQELKQLVDGSSVKVTVAHWVLPSGGILDNGGLKPDVEATVSDEDAKNGKDPQYDAALKTLQAQITGQ